MRIRACVLAFILTASLSTGLFAQAAGTISGRVTVEDRNLALHNVKVLLVQLGRSVDTSEDGTYSFGQVPPGLYDLVANTPGMSSDLQSVELPENGSLTVDFQLRISPIRQDITVTATGVEQTAFESFQIVGALDSFELAENGATAIGEVLQNQPGIAKRSAGPGASRPVIRGFDGDRVLVLQDGMRTGSLASQSADHGEPINVLQIETLEVMKGPGTLLYGSNAIGGVINAISGHHQMKEQAHEGFRGYLTGIGGSANRYGGGGLGFEYGAKNWLFWGSGGNQKTGNFKTPLGTVPNSGTRITNGSSGLGWFGDSAFASASYQYDDGRYGIPSVEQEHDEPGAADLAGHAADIDYFRRNVRISGGARNISSFVEGMRLSGSYTGWIHKELEKTAGETTVGTVFDNKQYSWQGYFDQRRAGRLTGTFGLSGVFRDYRATGEEALSPPVKQNVLAVFGLEELNFDRFKMQFGGRLEDTRYTPEGLPDRSFTGMSASIGLHIPLWKGSALVTNYTHSYRAPALEELYNNGPHLGNLAFEIGNTSLERERSDGLDVSLRHVGTRVKVEGNFYYYAMGNFVYLAPTGAQREDLNEAVYAQEAARFAGTEVSLDFELHPSLWVTSGLDYVNAKLTDLDTPLPRIPPLRGRFGVDMRYKGLSVKPELTMTNAQEKIFPTETRTAGYTVLDLTASYTLPAQHFSHHFAVSLFNLGDRLYRNHVSFLKDLVPEIGRGVRLTYSMRFF